MARFIFLFAALLLLAGPVVKAQDPAEEDNPDGSSIATDPTTTTQDITTTTKATTTTTTTEEPTTTTTEPTTTTPETTTTKPTTTTPQTTTTKPTTTTAETTTTEATTTSTAPPTTTTAPPKPDSHIKYYVTENNVTCVMVAGEIFFNVNYTLIDNSTVVSSVFVPSLGVKVDGSCSSPLNDSQYISFSWGNNSVQMYFKTEDKDSWAFTTLAATFYMDDDYFVNATDAGKMLDLTVDYDFSPGEVGVNHSFICRSSLSSNNVSATMDKADYGARVTSTLKNIQIQAFNKIKNEPDFVDSVHCTADNTSDVVPIAVGCALAGLVVIVLIAYLVGRRRRSGAYQSV